jgi:hypothetical protein
MLTLQARETSRRTAREEGTKPARVAALGLLQVALQPCCLSCLLGATLLTLQLLYGVLGSFVVGGSSGAQRIC